jgi:hypothetical protein
MLVLAILVGTVIFRREAGRTNQICEVCQRPVHAGMGYRLVLAKGSQTACCPRCGIHYDLNHPGIVHAAFAKDFYTGAEIPAEKAYYVEGGNEVYCAHVKPLERKELESSAQLAYDRCLPTLVAFKTRPEAETYQKEHGGRVLNYAQAVQSVKE